MKIITADHLGLCFGVRDALALTRSLANPTQITIHGQLVHNPLVNHALQSQGFTLAPESHDQLPATPSVLITAHGISNRERHRLTAAGKTLIDTTCPLVKKAHHAALHLQSLGFHLLVIGQKNHVEIRGLTGDLNSFDILESPNDIRTFPHSKLGLIAQTTCPEREARALVDLVRRLNPHALIRFINTICQPTRDRQLALERLLDHVDLLVVVGGRNSNNTRRLVQRAQQRRVPALHIEHPDELEKGSGIFSSPNLTIGLTAGTSTLPETITAVRERLESMFANPSTSPQPHYQHSS